MKKLESVSLDPMRPERVTKISSQLSEKKKRKLINFLREHAYVFAWSYEDMLGIYPRVISHRLVVNPASKPIK